MALTPELDALASRVSALQALIDALDGKQPIEVTIGSFQMLVDPATAPEAYTRGADVLRGLAHGTIIDLRNAIATSVLAISQPPPTDTPTITTATTEPAAAPEPATP